MLIPISQSTSSFPAWYVYIGSLSLFCKEENLCHLYSHICVNMTFLMCVKESEEGDKELTVRPECNWATLCTILFHIYCFIGG